MRSKTATLTLRNAFINLRPLLGCQWALFYILIGARECGKSFAVLDYFLHCYFERGLEFVWIRLKESQTSKLLSNNAQSLIDPELIRKYKMDPEKLKRIGKSVYYNGKPMCKVLALSTFYNDKGVANFDSLKDEESNKVCYNIAVDEFQRESGENNTFDITYALVNQLENLVRHSTKVRVFLMGNTLEKISDVLAMFKFIPYRSGVFKLKRRKCVVYNVPKTEAYKELRKNSIAQILSPDSSTFSNEIKFDDSKIKKPGRKPLYCMVFQTEKFTVYEGDVICRYKGEKKQNIAMEKLMGDQSEYSKDLFNAVYEKTIRRRYFYKDRITQVLFESCVRMVKK